MKHIRKTKLFVFLVLAILVFTMVSSAVQAQDQSISIVIERIITTNFPEVEAFISVYDQNTLQISGITPGDVVLLEDDVVIPAGEFSFFRETNLDTPLAIALLIDTTGSMFEGDPSPLDNSIASAKLFVENLLPHDEVGVISFSDEIKVQQTLTTEKSLVLEALDNLEGDGNTPLYSALFQGVEMLRESEKKKVVILITDGYDSTSREHSLEDTLALANEYLVTVYPIGFGPALISSSGVIALASNLDEIAARTGGFEQYFQDSTSLPQAFNEINQFLRRVYHLTYTSSLPADDTEHALQVQISLAGETYSDTATFVPNPVKLQVLEPQPGSVLSIETPITIDTSAPSKITQVQIWIDGEMWQSFTAPTKDETIYQANWDLAGITPGEHEITVRVFDTIGNTKETNLTVSVREPIIIEILNPEDGAVLVTRPMIEVRVDAVAGIGSASLLLNDNTLATFTEENFSFEWPPQAKDYGLYRITVEVVDNLGHSATQEINVRIGDTLIQDTISDEESSLGNLFLIIFGGGGIAVALLLIVLPLVLKKKKPKSKPALSGSPKASQQSPQAESDIPPSQEPHGVTPYQQAPSDAALVLQEVAGLKPGSIWPLEKAEISIGRSKTDNDIQLQGATASRRMAVIRISGNAYLLHPLHPENPVLINNQPISQQVLLNAGDEISMGESTFLVIAKPAGS